MYAIIEAGGKQYKVEKGDIIHTQKLGIDEGKIANFGVVAIFDDKKFICKDSCLKGAKVSGKVLKNGRKKKIVVFTYKAKKNEKRKLGHRQPYTRVEISSIKI